MIGLDRDEKNLTVQFHGWHEVVFVIVMFAGIAFSLWCFGAGLRFGFEQGLKLV